MASIHLIGLAGSLRKASTNRGLLRAAQASLPESVTMEIADQLVGVTMQEQGVSRIVAVDMESALKLQQSNEVIAV